MQDPFLLLPTPAVMLQAITPRVLTNLHTTSMQHGRMEREGRVAGTNHIISCDNMMNIVTVFLQCNFNMVLLLLRYDVTCKKFQKVFTIYKQNRKISNKNYSNSFLNKQQQ